MAKVSFFYANGTAYLINLVEAGFSITNSGIVRIGNRVLNPVTSRGSATLVSPTGIKVSWNGGPESDPFPYLLDSETWNVTKINYPASALGIGQSVTNGITKTVAAIKLLKKGTPFALGGYSQGAAVMSGVYNEIKSTTGSLYSRRNDFIGGVCFGNPRRQVNFRGEVGGTWSGAWDVAGSNTGGHGSFPATGPYARLSGCDATKWIEFTAPGDVFSSVGDSATGVAWMNANDFILGKSRPQIAGQFLTSALAGLLGLTNANWTAVTQAFALGGVENYFVDAADTPFVLAGNGHVTYPLLGPPGSTGVYATTSVVSGGKTYLKPTGDTCYQVALKWLQTKADAWATAPVAISTKSSGWSTTLVPPAS